MAEIEDIFELAGLKVESAAAFELVCCAIPKIARIC